MNKYKLFESFMNSNLIDDQQEENQQKEEHNKRDILRKSTISTKKGVSNVMESPFLNIIESKLEKYEAKKKSNESLQYLKSKAFTDPAIFVEIASREYKRKKKLCKNFSQSFWCYTIDCPYVHPKDQIICPNIIPKYDIRTDFTPTGSEDVPNFENAKLKIENNQESIILNEYKQNNIEEEDSPATNHLFRFCTNLDCQYAHPNQSKVIPHLVQLRNQYLVQHANDKNFIEKFNNALYNSPIIDAERDTCSAYLNTGFCQKLSCKKQHFVTRLMGSLEFQINHADKQFELVEVDSGEYNLVVSDWNMHQGKQKLEVLRIERIVSPHLINAWFQRKVEVEKLDVSNRVEYMVGFHGTKAENLKGILTRGFLAYKNKRGLHGEGTYFARNPLIAAHYCGKHNQLILCHIIVTEKDKWVSKKQYYVISNTSGCLPRYLITFKPKSIK
mmetsp:Transcript_329/g.601  ORF Transcript_329/g.601 Transcript_329/m.601 type:complete len:444 (+) Transcript_329:3991-5322(+)